MGIMRFNRGAILAVPEATLRAVTTVRLRERGWRVWHARSTDELRQMACAHMPGVVVTPAEGWAESGWLTCAKLRRAQPRMRVVLLGDEEQESQRLARFVGAAALISPNVDAGELIAEIEGSPSLV